jgi:RecJ-like exonuclease
MRPVQFILYRPFLFIAFTKLVCYITFSGYPPYGDEPMKLDTETRIVTFESKPCYGCSENGISTGKRFANEWQPCSECHGTGRGKRGGRNGCQKCNGMGKIIVQTSRLEICPNCNGTGKQPENNCDDIPAGWWQSFTFKVYRQERNQTYNEYLLGVGCVYSCTDYGTATGMTDEAIIAKVKSEEDGHFLQLCKVANKENRLADHIGIFVNRQGFSVRAVYESDATDTKRIIARERGKDEGFRFGTAIARNGGNGTLGAIYK